MSKENHLTVEALSENGSAGKSISANELKPRFQELKDQWDEKLKQFFLEENKLNPEFSMVVACPHCASSSVEETFDLNGFVHHRCAECRTIYVSPRLNETCTKEIFDDYYQEMYTRSMLSVFEERKALIGRRKFRQAASFTTIDGAGRVLDIGAGIGEVIDVFRDEGWTTHAIEPNNAAAEWLLKRGHQEVHRGTLESYISPHKFDVIMAWSVIEHAEKPDQFIKKVCELLATDGVFVSEEPHGESLLVDMVRDTGMDPKRILMGEQHVILYSTQAYLDLHEKNGLENIHLQTNGLDIDTIFQHYNMGAADNISMAIQKGIDSKLYGDLLRGFWRLEKV